MTVSRWIWLSVGLIYVVFFSWYTSFGGPLSQQEIEHYMDEIVAANPQASAASLAVLRRFMEEDTGDDFVMLNVIDMYDEPLQIEGVEPGESSDEVLSKYMTYMYPALFSRACHPVMMGNAANSAMDLMNAPGMEHWTRGALMRYRSRRDLFEISTNPAFRGSHDFKVAAMAKTIAFPLDPWFQLGDPRLLLGLLLALLATILTRVFNHRGSTG